MVFKKVKIKNLSRLFINTNKFIQSGIGGINKL